MIYLILKMLNKLGFVFGASKVEFLVLYFDLGKIRVKVCVRVLNLHRVSIGLPLALRKPEDGHVGFQWSRRK